MTSDPILEFVEAVCSRRKPTMAPRAWKPLDAEEILLPLPLASSGKPRERNEEELATLERRELRNFYEGSRFEPGHALQPDGTTRRVRVYLDQEGWVTAYYNRTTCEFMTYKDRSWWPVDSKQVQAWARYPINRAAMADPVMGRDFLPMESRT